MSFLKKNVNKKGTFLRKEENEDEIPEHGFMEEFVSLIVYLSATVAYFVKKNLKRMATIPILIIICVYLVYHRYFKKSSNTEMIGDMEVPKLKDNYDLNLD